MLIHKKTKAIFIFVFLTVYFQFNGMERENTSSYTYQIKYAICESMFCSATNEYGKNYLQNLSPGYIANKPCFDFLKEPFTIKNNNDQLDVCTKEYCFAKKEHIDNIAHLGLYGIQLCCSGTVYTSGFDEKYYDHSPQNNLKLSFLEAAIIAILREYKIDRSFDELTSKHNHWCLKNDTSTPSLQNTLEKTIRQELTYPCNEQITNIFQDSLLLKKRYFPALLLKPSTQLGKELAYQLCKSEVFLDMFLYPSIVKTVEDDKAQAICNNFSITITEKNK